MNRTRYYYVNAASQSVGPLEAHEIQALSRAGLLSISTPVIAEGTDQWSTAGALGLVGTGASFDGQPQLSSVVVYRDLASTSVFQALSLTGYFLVYLLPAYTRDLEAITRRPRIGFPAACILGLVTLGIFSNVLLILYAFELEKIGLQRSTPGRQTSLGLQILILIVVGYIVSFLSGGLAFLVNIGLCTYAVFIFQKELNLYATRRPESGMS